MKTIYVKIVPRNTIVQRRFEFCVEENTKFVKNLRFNPSEFSHIDEDESNMSQYTARARSEQGATVTASFRKSDPKHVLINMTVKCGRSGTDTKFYVLVYRDRYQHSLIEIWLVTLHAVPEAVKIEGEIGQTNWKELLVDNITERATRSNLEVFVRNERELTAMIQENILRLGFKTMHAELKSNLVNLVDTEKRLIVAILIVKTNALMPFISKSYKEDIPVSKSEPMKLPFVNTASERIDYTLSTNYPTLLRFKTNKITLEPQEKHTIIMKFMPNPHIETKDFFIFLNNAKDKTIECFCITINYS